MEEDESFQGIHISTNLLFRRQFVRLKETFIRNFLLEVDKRFPHSDLGILDDLNSVLNPKLFPLGQNSIIQHAVDCLEKCIDFFGTGPSPLVNGRELRLTHRQFKNLMNENRALGLTEFCIVVIYDYKEAYPDFATLASILCTCPLTSVPCERGFSLQNRHHSSVSCRRSVQNVSNRMMIEYSCKAMSETDKSVIVSKSAEKFAADKCHKL